MKWIMGIVVIAVASPGGATAGERHALVAGDLEVVVVVNDTELAAEHGPRFARTARVASVRRGELDYLVGAGMPDEFSLDGEGTTGFAEAAAGGGFLKVGLGVLGRDAEAMATYDAFWRYPVSKDATAVVTRREDTVLEIEARHPEVAGVELTLGQRFSVAEGGVLVIDYWLRNAGTAVWRGRHYNHHFFGFGGRRADGGYGLRPQGVPEVEPRVRRGVEVRGPKWRLTRWPTTSRAAVVVFERGRAVTAEDEVGGFELSHAEGGSVTMRASRPVAVFTWWADFRSVCPELFVEIEVGPGKVAEWRSEYRFGG